MTKAYLALLRGINVGSKNKIPMAELKACFEELGCENVRTYIASGNVMFESHNVPLSWLRRFRKLYQQNLDWIASS